MKYYIQLPSNAIDQLIVEAGSVEEACDKFNNDECEFDQTFESDITERGLNSYSAHSVERMKIFNDKFEQVKCFDYLKDNEKIE